MSTIGASGDSEIVSRIAIRIRELRKERHYTLDVLASRSGVSRSSISMIERCTMSPTAVVLDKLATALNVPLASLFEAPPGYEAVRPLARSSSQLTWRDPQSGYLRCNVSPPSWPSPIQITEVKFPPGAMVSYETSDREVEIHQQVWILSGHLEVTLGDETFQLEDGDCLAMRLDQLTVFKNSTSKWTRYVVVVVSQRLSQRRSQ